MNQDELSQLITNRDEKAVAAMYDLYGRSLFSVISNIVKDTNDAQRVLLQVFKHCWNNISKYESDHVRLYTWLLIHARQTAIKHAGAKEQLSSSDNFLKLIDYSADLDHIGTREFAKKLKPKCIQMIELLLYRGILVDAVASNLDISLGVVKSQNRECLMNLRHNLQL